MENSGRTRETDRPVRRREGEWGRDRARKEEAEPHTVYVTKTRSPENEQREEAETWKDATSAVIKDVILEKLEV